eukprot:TRINITY_DN12272_c0_g1_i1.p1 TRINITY_DN12272_c0_g1~~TRINITY_DN12272_c0_g1_i1.p1  ORF type:complete len:103 (-),score=6.11 TRINITY_DN12272_c0_g1_i1:449-712(-)
MEQVKGGRERWIINFYQPVRAVLLFFFLFFFSFLPPFFHSFETRAFSFASSFLSRTTTVGKRSQYSVETTFFCGTKGGLQSLLCVDI